MPNLNVIKTEQENILSTQRLSLRPFTLNDLDLLYKLNSDPVVMQYIPSGVRTIEETYIDLQDDVAHQEKHGFSKWAVFLKDSSKFIGRAGWAWMETTKEVEVGFRLLPQYWGNGFATEILEALLSWGRINISFPLIAFTYPENSASIHVLEKVGMIYAGRDKYEGREIIVYSG